MKFEDEIKERAGDGTPFETPGEENDAEALFSEETLFFEEAEEETDEPMIPDTEDEIGKFLYKETGSERANETAGETELPDELLTIEELKKLQEELSGEYVPVRERPKREKAVPGVQIGKLHLTNEQAKKLLIGTGAGVLALLLAAMLGFAVSGSLKRREAVRQAATPQTAAEDATPSEAELEAERRQKAVQAELSSYTNLGIADASGYINLRSQPDSIDMTNIIGKLPSQAACTVVSEEGDWVLISSGGIQGYAYRQYIKTGEEAKAIAPELMKERAVILAEVLNIRSAPEVSAENVVGKARKGERYEVLSVDGDWAQIVADFTDTADAAYIKISGDDGEQNAEVKYCLDAARKLDLREMALTQYDQLVVSNTDGYINIRETPEDQGIDNICGKFPSHAGAELLETAESDGRTWYKIKSGGVTGYVSAEFCATGEEAKAIALQSAQLTAFVRTDALNVREEPSTDASAWTQVTKNQAYHVLNQLDGWVELELDSSDEDGGSEKAYVSTRDNNVEVRYGLPEAVEYYPAVEAANEAAAFRNQIVNYACQFVGNPYVWGGTSLTNGADCSGFTMKVLEHFGISIPRVSREQAKAGTAVTSDQMKPGDLVFYANSRGVINHVGMYIGNGQVVNAASRRSGIRIYRWNYRTPVAIRNVIGA